MNRNPQLPTIMPYTVIMMAWRKPGMTPAEYRHHYETSREFPSFLNLASFLKALLETHFAAYAP